MALLFMDGFNHYTKALLKWDYALDTSSDTAITHEFGRYSSSSLKLDDGWYGKNILPQDNTIIAGFAFYAVSTCDNSLKFITEDGGSGSGGIQPGLSGAAGATRLAGARGRRRPRLVRRVPSQVGSIPTQSRQ